MNLFNRQNSTRISCGNGSTNSEFPTFDGLWDSFAPRVRGYLFLLTGNRAEADDLTQETFLAAFQGQSTYKANAPPLAWLLGIARRRWRDSRRKAVLDTAPFNEEALAVRDRAVPVAEITALRASLTDALNRLPEAERDVLLLTAVQGLTYKETAAVLEEPVGTVKWRVFEATRKLRTLLTAEDTSPETQTLPQEITYAKPDAKPDATTDTRTDRSPIARASRSR